MIKNFIAGIIVGFTSGSIVSWFLARKQFDREWDDNVTTIYNECYREVTDELEVNKKKKDEYKRIVKTYTKPDLKEVHLKKIEEDILNEESEDDALESSKAIEDEMNYEIAKEADKDNQPTCEFIDANDFGSEEPHYQQMGVFFYSVDNMFLDDDDNVLGDAELSTMFCGHIGEITKRLRLDDTIYFRNNHIETEYEIRRLKYASTDIAFETHKERERRLARRKTRDM